MKQRKKILALVMAAVFLLGISTTVFAKETGASLTVKGLSGTVTEIRLYQMIGLEEEQNQWMIKDWAKKYVKIDKTGQYSYDLTQLSVPQTPDKSLRTSENKAVFGGLETGAYLVAIVDTTGVTTYQNGVVRTYEYDEDSHLIKPTQGEMVAKSHTSKTLKTQQETVGITGDDVVEVGSIISYEITTVIPYSDEVANQTFWLSDTLSGAAYNGDGEAKIGDRVVIKNQDLQTEEGKTEAETFRYDLSSLLKDNQYAGQTLRFVYTATVLATDEVKNVASASNNPQGNMPLTTAYTGKVSITKYGEAEETLQGANFILFRIHERTPEYAVIKNGYLKEWSTDRKDATEVVTDKKGTAVIKGLNVGIYYVTETVAPKGYSVENTQKVNDVSYAGKAVVEKITENQKVSVEGKVTVSDSKLPVLPYTGGKGIVWFYVMGILLLSAGVTCAVLAKKKYAKKV